MVNKQERDRGKKRGGHTPAAHQQYEKEASPRPPACESGRAEWNEGEPRRSRNQCPHPAWACERCSREKPDNRCVSRSYRVAALSFLLRCWVFRSASGVRVCVALHTPCHRAHRRRLRSRSRDRDRTRRPLNSFARWGRRPPPAVLRPWYAAAMRRFGVCEAPAPSFVGSFAFFSVP